jgi:hypothetical protein
MEGRIHKERAKIRNKLLEKRTNKGEREPGTQRKNREK